MISGILMKFIHSADSFGNMACNYVVENYKMLKNIIWKMAKKKKSVNPLWLHAFLFYEGGKLSVCTVVITNEIYTE